MSHQKRLENDPTIVFGMELTFGEPIKDPNERNGFDKDSGPVQFQSFTCNRTQKIELSNAFKATNSARSRL